jgi:hypothetical protein
MNATTSAGLAVRGDQRDARRWIERQLRWERTLGALRGRADHPTSRAA